MVNAQLKKIHSYPFIKPHDPSEMIRFSRIVSGCDLTFQPVLNSAVMKLTQRSQSQMVDLSSEVRSKFQDKACFLGIDEERR